MFHGIGYLTGIIANAQPVIFVPEANKTTQFIKLCNQANIPIVYLHNVTGFMVGAKTEAQGLIKAGAQLVNAVSNSKVSNPPHNTQIPCLGWRMLILMGRCLRSVLFVGQVMERGIMLCADVHMILDSSLHGPLDVVVSWVQIS